MQNLHSDLNVEQKILVTGASGYIGGRLVRQLLRGSMPIRVMVRDPEKISKLPWIDKVEVSVANAKDYASTKAALQGVHTAFYLLHSMTAGPDFEKLEIINARNFAKAAQDADVKQIVYLGGIANDRRMSKHMRSRVNTGRILTESAVPVIEIRAAIIVGVGAASFELLRHLSNELPFTTTPKWVSNRTQPIGISDVLYYLSEAASLTKPIDRIFDIGGPDVLKYSDLFKRFAEMSGSRKRWVIRFPIPSPALFGLFIGLFTKLPTPLARPLVGSLISEFVVDSKKSLSGVIDPPIEGLLTLSEAVELALTPIPADEIESRWTDPGLTPAPWAISPSDPEWAGDSTSREGANS